eukprot:2435017-Prymnesium_polylepis.1
MAALFASLCTASSSSSSCCCSPRLLRRERRLLLFPLVAPVGALLSGPAPSESAGTSLLDRLANASAAALRTPSGWSGISSKTSAGMAPASAIWFLLSASALAMLLSLTAAASRFA